jgi:hypothetical protein
MKKLMVFLGFGILAILIGAGIATSQERINLNVHYGEYRIRVDLKPRVLIIQNDGDRLTMQYFSNSAFEPRMQFLGEEIYINGRKVNDTFKEND